MRRNEMPGASVGVSERRLQSIATPVCPARQWLTFHAARPEVKTARRRWRTRQPDECREPIERRDQADHLGTRGTGIAAVPRVPSYRTRGQQSASRDGNEPSLSYPGRGAPIAGFPGQARRMQMGPQNCYPIHGTKNGSHAAREPSGLSTGPLGVAFPDLWVQRQAEKVLQGPPESAPSNS
jgi:hypothetical protein